MPASLYLTTRFRSIWQVMPGSAFAIMVPMICQKQFTPDAPGEHKIELQI